MSLENPQRYRHAPPPGHDLFPIGSRPNPARPVVRVDAATWRGGLRLWKAWPPSFEAEGGMSGHAPTGNDSVYRAWVPGDKSLEPRIIEHRQLKRSRAVAAALLVFMNKNGLCWASRDLIADTTSFKADNLTELLANLVDLGFLHMTHGTREACALPGEVHSEEWPPRSLRALENGAPLSIAARAG